MSTEELKPPIDWSKRDRTEALLMDEISHLVQAVDEGYFSDQDEVKSSSQKSAEESTTFE